jgi:MYXO-CTERM domain-containing protein
MLRSHSPARRPLSALGLVVLALALGCTPDRPQLTIARRPIINGEIDTTHQSVVALVYTAYGQVEQFCTGTVIAPRAVLTAGHCYKESGLPPAQTKVFIGQTVGGAGTLIPVASAYVHPNYYLASNGAPVNDVCVVILTQDAPVPAMAWQQTPLGNVVGQTVTLVGYGVTNAAAQTGNGTRRSVQEVISDVDNMYLYYQGMTHGTCQGDSGGPMLSQGAVETILGVTSFGDESCVQLGANTRVDIYASFIQQYAGSSAQPVTVSFTSPSSGATLGSTIPIAVTAQSPAGVARVELYLDGTLQTTLTTAPWSYQLTGVADGTHQIRARATGTDGGSGEATVAVTVVAPQCSTENPCNPGYDCVDGQCVVHTPPGGCSDQSPCLTGFHCENAVCVANPAPSPGTTGAHCNQNTDCLNGMCVDGNSGNGYCTQECGQDLDCPNQAACLDFGGIALCGPPYSAMTTATNGGRELIGGCRAAPGDAPAPGAALLGLLGLALAAVGSRRR